MAKSIDVENAVTIELLYTDNKGVRRCATLYVEKNPGTGWLDVEVNGKSHLKIIGLADHEEVVDNPEEWSVWT